MYKAIIQIMRKRKALFWEGKLFRDSSDTECYKKQRNHVLSMLRAYKLSFLQQTEVSRRSRILEINQAAWQNTIPASLIDGTITAESIYSKTALVNNLITLFMDVSTSTQIAALYDNHDSANFPTNFLTTLLTLSVVSICLNLLRQIDDITPRMLKSTAYSIAPSLTNYRNLSHRLETGMSCSSPQRRQPEGICNWIPSYIYPSYSQQILESHVKEIILNSISETNPIPKYK